MTEPDPTPTPRPHEGDSSPIPQISAQQANQPKSTPDPRAPCSDLSPGGFNVASAPQEVEISLGTEASTTSSEEPAMADSSPPSINIEDEREAQILEDLAQDIRRLLQDPSAGLASELPEATVQATKLDQDSELRESKLIGRDGDAHAGDSGSNQPAQKTRKRCDAATIGTTHSISKLSNQNGSMTEDRSSAPSLNRQDGQVADRLRSKGNIDSNQQPQSEREPCINSANGTSPSSLNGRNQKRCTKAEKAKWVVDSPNFSAPHKPWKESKYGQHQASKREGASSWRSQTEFQSSEDMENWTEVKGPYWWRRELQHSSSSGEASQRSATLRGIEKFKQYARGKCFNCFSSDHVVRECRSPTCCWRCSGRGHRASSCPSKTPEHRLKQPAPASKHSTLQFSSPSHSTSNHSSARDARRSYLEVARGDPAPAAMAAYPGDPRARPDGEQVFVSAAGAIKRRRDALIGRAAVCWLEGNSHNTEPYHVSNALRSKLGLGFEDFQVVKHYPEQYLVIFSEERLRQRATRQHIIEDGGRVFNFATWNETREAEDAQLEFRVNICIEGIPPHAWGEDVAALILGRSCAIHYVEEHTRRRERTRTYDVWAWCADPNKIPKKVWLTITHPDAEQPPVDVQVHQEPPIGPKHALTYKVFPHLAVVEDLSFINGDGRQGGPPNRKMRRDLLWRYGEPDSLGEAQGRHGGDRGRQEHRNHRRYDNHDGRGGSNHRRHRCASAWGCVTCCRNGTAGYYIRNFRGPAPHGGGSYRSRLWEEPKRFMYKKKMAPAPALNPPKASNKNTKHVSFAEPLVSFFGETNEVASEPPPFLILPVSCSINPANIFDPMLHEFLIHAEQGGPVKKATVTVDQELLKARKSGNNMVQDKGADAGADPLQDLLHFDQPLTQNTMEALQVLVEHGAKKMKKGADPKKQGPATSMEVA